MASNGTITVRIALDGGAEIQKQFQVLGKDAEALGKSLEAAFGNLKAAGAFDKTVAGISATFKSVGAAAANFGKSFSQASQALDKVQGSARNVVGQVTKVTAVVTGLTAAFVALTKSAADTGDAISKSALQAGTTAQNFQALQLASVKLGGDADTVTNFTKQIREALDGLAKDDSVEKFTNGLRDGGANVLSAANNFGRASSLIQNGVQTGFANGVRVISGVGAAAKQAGAELTDLQKVLLASGAFDTFTGKLKDSDEALISFANEFAKLSAEGQQKLGLKLFGEEASRLIPILAKGGAAFKEFRDAARGSGLILSADELSTLDKARVAFNTLGLELSLVKAKLGAAVAPVLTDFLEFLSKTLEDNVGDLKAFATELATNAKPVLADFIAFLSGNEGKIRDDSIFKGLRQGIKDFGTSIRDTYTTIIRPVFNGIIGILQFFLNTFNAVFGTNLKAGTILAGAALLQFFGVFRLGKDLVLAFLAVAKLLNAAGLFAPFQLALGVLKGAILEAFGAGAVAGLPAAVNAAGAAAAVEAAAAGTAIGGALAAAVVAAATLGLSALGALVLSGKAKEIEDNLRAALRNATQPDTTRNLKDDQPAIEAQAVKDAEAVQKRIDAVIPEGRDFTLDVVVDPESLSKANTELKDLSDRSKFTIPSVEAPDFTAVDQGFKQLADRVGTVAEQISNSLDDLKSKITVTTQNAQKAQFEVPKASPLFDTSGLRPSDNIEDRRGQSEIVQQQADALLASIQQAAEQAFADILTRAQELPGQLASVWVQIGTDAATAFTALGPTIADAISAAVEGVRSFIGNVGQDLVTGITSALQGIEGVVANLISSLNSQLAALEQRIAAVVAAAQAAASAAASAGSGGGGGDPAFATGGYVRGPGTGTSDSIRAWLSAGEFVINAKSVRAIGLPLLRALNAGRGGLKMLRGFPGFSAGGLVPQFSSSPVRMAAIGGGGIERRVAVNISLGGQSVGEVLSDRDVADKLVRFARQTSARSAGRAPSWNGGI